MDYDELEDEWLVGACIFVCLYILPPAVLVAVVSLIASVMAR